MARKKQLQYGYTHVKRTPRKRAGRHAKKYSKRIPKRSKNRGQGV